MDTLFQGILDILNGLIPSAVTADFLRPLLRVLRIMK